MQLCGRVHRFWLLASIVAIVCLYLVTIYFDVKIEEWGADRFILGRTGVSVNSSTKRILFWNSMFGDETFYFGHGDVFSHCDLPKGSCYATHDRHSMRIQDFDAVLFHGNELSVKELPVGRNSSQSYIFVNLESPATRPLTISFFENYFNLTMTYRLDSDIPWPYYVIRSKKTGNIVAPARNTVWKTPANATAGDGKNDTKSKELEAIRGKKKTAVWFVSNCHSNSGREKYIEELAKHVDVDIYGRCGSEVKCRKEDDCFRTLVEPDYFFYLSFENSLCQDYVTEKLSNALRYNVVPVVYGGANYSLFAPPNSYINALDFDNPKHLAQYLKRLTKDPTGYAKYFRWKEYYEVGYSNSFTICYLCKFLHQSNITKVYDPLSNWYRRDRCPLQDKLEGFSYLTKFAIMFNDI